MGQKSVNKRKTKKTGKPLLLKILCPMLLLALVQMIVFLGILTANGGFSYLKKDAYDMICEKTENRKNYVEVMLNQKTGLVYETALEINAVTEEILEKEGLDAGAVCTDPKLNEKILSACTDRLISLIRRDMVNDAFVILDAGSLYESEDGERQPGIYLRDTDTNTNSTKGNEDIFMELGSSQIAKEHGLALDSGWALYLDMRESKEVNLDFYRKPLENHAAYADTPLYNLGYWSQMSSISSSQQACINYSLPLMTKDGTVYGVVGIGILEKTIRQNLPLQDFAQDSACYILGADLEGSNEYEQMMHSGASYARLVTEQTQLTCEKAADYRLYDLTAPDGPDCIGSIQELNLYNSGSPYQNEHWALISVADQNYALSMYHALVRTLLISMVVTLVVCILLSVVISRNISRPVASVVKALDEGKLDQETVKYDSSGISEIDRLISSVEELQAAAREYAFRVSRIIAMSGDRMGVFLCDCRTKRVFVSDSLINMLDITAPVDKERTISFREFGEVLARLGNEKEVWELPIFGETIDMPDDYSGSQEVNCIDPHTKEQAWFKFNLARSKDNIFGLVQDVTLDVEEKHHIAKAKDEEYMEKLLQANQALRDAYAAATHASQAKTDFLSRMSHDIRTPMNGIIGMTAIAKENLDNREKIADCLEKISTSGRFLLSLINDVLDMSKIESGKFVLTKEEIDLPSLAESLIDIIRPSVNEKHHTLDVNIHKMEHPYVIGDSLRIRQMFMNLMSNAVKYTPKGGHLVFTLSEKDAQHTSERQTSALQGAQAGDAPGRNVGCYEFIFKDNGNGITPEFLEKLFEPFERSEDDRVNKEQGTGLGMAITHTIVKMMNGDIRVESEVNKGSTFTVTLFLVLSDKQVADADAEQEPQTVSSGSEQSALADAVSEQRFAGHHVLVVDDNELNREVASEILSMAGLSVETAQDGKEAVELFSASAPGTYEMIFLDIQMPVMNGYEAARAIRALSREDAGKIPLVAMTADAFAEDVRSAREAGMNAHVAKPLELDKLFAVMDQWLTIS